MQLTKDFNLIEFACHDGTVVPDDLICNVQVLATNLQTLRDDLGVPIYILSGYRTPSHNRKVGGATRSQHLVAKAGDLQTKTMTPKQLHARIEKLIKAGKMKNGGLGLYKTFVHYDVASVRRWVG